MRLITALFILLAPALLQAHPGHGVSNGHDVLHFLVSMGHAGPALFLVFAASFYLMRRIPKAKSRSAKH